MKNSRGAVVSTPNQVYEDFVPSSKLAKEEHFDTIHINLPGFKKEELRIQLTKTGILKINGQRPTAQNKWQRFQKEFPISENCDKTKIRAKFENQILHIRQPKIITSATKTDKEFTATEAENTPAAKRQTTTLRDEFRKQDNADINSTPAKKLSADESSSSSSSYNECESEMKDDETTGNARCLAAKLKNPRRVMKMTVVALTVLGIGFYVANAMKSANEAEEFMRLFFTFPPCYDCE